MDKMPPITVDEAMAEIRLYYFYKSAAAEKWHPETITEARHLEAHADRVLEHLERELREAGLK